MKYADEYIPEYVQTESGSEYLKVLIPIERCATCNCSVVRPDVAQGPSPFDEILNTSLDAQIKRSTHEPVIRFVGGHRDSSPVCVACVAAGKIFYECHLCHCKVYGNMLQESIGDDHLCVECYRVVPAKIWDETLEKLHEEHRYDNDNC